MPSQTFNNQLAADLAAGRITSDQALNSISEALHSEGATLLESTSGAYTYLNRILAEIDTYDTGPLGDYVPPTPMPTPTPTPIPDTPEAAAAAAAAVAAPTPAADTAAAAATPVVAATAAPAAAPAAAATAAPADILAALVDGTISWDDAYTALFDARGPKTISGLTPEQINDQLQGALVNAYKNTFDLGDRDELVTSWEGVPQNVLDQVIAPGTVSVVQDGKVVTPAIAAGAAFVPPSDIFADPTTKTGQWQSGLAETEAGRRDLYSAYLAGQPITAGPLRRFEEAQFDPIQARYLSQQALGRAPSFTDFLGTSPSGTLAQDIPQLQALFNQQNLAPGSAGESFVRSFQAAPFQTAGGIGSQYRIQNAPEAFRNFIRGQEPYRISSNLLQGALTGPQSFSSFVGPGAGGNLSDLLGKINPYLTAFDLEDPSYTDLSPPTDEMQGLVADLRDNQQFAYDLALQSVLQNTQRPYQAGRRRQAQREFDRFKMDRPGESFMPYFLEHGRFG
jgi:hypothetical protein